MKTATGTCIALLMIAPLVALLPSAQAMQTGSDKCLAGGYSWNQHETMSDGSQEWEHGSGCELGTQGVQCYSSTDDHYNSPNPNDDSTTQGGSCALQP